MPLLDHFHPPLLGRRHWEGFHGWWAAEIAAKLNDLLPSDYFAEFQVKYGTRVEVDIATFNEPGLSEPRDSQANGTAVLAEVWTPSIPAAVLPAIFPDSIEVRVFSSVAGPTLVASIELVSPGNKDRPATRRAFVAKVATYLQQGIGVVVLDIVTSRHANLHDELIGLLEIITGGASFPTPTPLYATAYRPAHRDERNEIDLWRESLEVGQVLPTLPLAVRGLGCLPIDLEATYMEARKRGRVD